MTSTRLLAPRKRQSGIALITALLLLIVVTIIAVAGSRNTLLQESMSGNMHDRNLAFQASEAALSDAIRQLQTGNNIATIGPVDQPTNPNFWLGFINNGDHDNDINEMNAVGFDLNDSPKYVVEEVESLPSIIADAPLEEPWYRITTYAEGGTGNAIVILHAGYRR